jgi:hypothetical protein
MQVIRQDHHRIHRKRPGGTHRTDGRARNTATASTEASSGRRRSDTTVKKNAPPGMNARLYLIRQPPYFFIIVGWVSGFIA